ncbi:MAG: LapA family protein [Pseudomonadota bacterium]
MIRFIKYLFLLAVLACLIVVALANRDPVTLNLLTPELANEVPFAWTYTLPLYMVVFGALAVGVILGYVFEFLREAAIRREASQRREQVKTLKRDLAKVKKENPAATDDVLAILDQSKKAG